MYSIDKDFNILNKFLALNTYDNEKHYDAIIVFGSALPWIVVEGYKLYLENQSDYFLIAGGKGHTTELMIQTLSDVININSENVSEACILKQLIDSKFQEQKKILLEEKSTNCGENIKYSFARFAQENIKVKDVLLIHDPLMQCRIDAVARKEFPNINFYNFAPFIPCVYMVQGSIEVEKVINGIWPRDRYISLLLGEMKRVIDDQDGYGPNGKNFIAHVDVPNEVIEAYQRVVEVYGDYMRN